MTTTNLTLYSVEDGAAWITLNRPEARNALSGALIGEVFAHLAAANADTGARCIVITGSGSAFCSGADLKDSPGEMVHSSRTIAYPELLAAIQDSPKPVIAAANGPAFAGGLGLIGAADIAIAADSAVFSFSEVRIGVIPAVISVVCLPKLGRHHGMKLFLTGERFGAVRAVEVGLLHRAVPAAQLVAAVNEEIDMIRRGGPNAVIECKRLVRRVPELSREAGFAETAPWSARLFASNEAQEGMAAFREKRPAAWLHGD
jgi:methylglutaconyl-CoA hydratase